MQRLAIDQDDFGIETDGERVLLRGPTQLTQGEPVPSRIDLVGHDRVADVSQMDANLVGAARLGLAANQGDGRETARGLRRYVTADLPPSSRVRIAIFSRDGRMEADAPIDVIAVALGDAVDQGEILLVHLAKFELKRQPAVGQVVLDDDQKPGRVAVEAVDDSRAILAARVESESKWNCSALTSVPCQFPFAGCVTMPGGLFTTVRASSS